VSVYNPLTSLTLLLFFFFDSPGCVIAELFTEGVPLFDLSQLLAYRNGLFSPDQVLNKIEDSSIRELVRMDYSIRTICVVCLWLISPTSVTNAYCLGVLVWFFFITNV